MTKVLIVDDDVDTLDSVARLLRIHGHEVVTEARAAQVVEVLRRERPDVLMQDCRMPGLNIERLVKSVRADPDLVNVPILLFTGSPEWLDVWRSIGADGIVLKSHDPARLGHVIDQEIQRCLHTLHPFPGPA